MIDKPFVANGVVRVVGVLPAVDFDNESMFAADQIDGVWADRLLPDELVALQHT